MGRQGQMEISLYQSTQEIGNDLRKKKKGLVVLSRESERVREGD
jgi:hypothetical protein